MKTLLVTPLEEEQAALAQSFRRQGCPTVGAYIGKLPVISVPDLSLSLALCGHGKAQAALQTQYLLDRFQNPQLVICAGAAGALVEELSAGDIVISTHTIEHDYIFRFVSRPSPHFVACSRTLAELRQVGLGIAGFQVQFGPVASGDEDIVGVGRAKELQQLTGALAVAWEGAGVARACAFNQVSFIEMRGITDAANESAATDFDTNLRVAMHNLSRLLVTWLRQQSQSVI